MDFLRELYIGESPGSFEWDPGTSQGIVKEELLKGTFEGFFKGFSKGTFEGFF